VSKRNSDHVVIDSKDGGSMRCLHCGDRQGIEYPIGFSVLIAMSNAYLKQHRRCRASPTPRPASGEGRK
jgi:ribosomal protein S14